MTRGTTAAGPAGLAVRSRASGDRGGRRSCRTAIAPAGRRSCCRSAGASNGAATVPRRWRRPRSGRGPAAAHHGPGDTGHHRDAREQDRHQPEPADEQAEHRGRRADREAVRGRPSARSGRGSTTRAAPAVSAIAMQTGQRAEERQGQQEAHERRRRTARRRAPATTGTTGTFDVAGTMLMSSIVGVRAGRRDQGCPGADPDSARDQSRSPWRISCLPASVIEPDSDGYTENV